MSNKAGIGLAEIQALKGKIKDCATIFSESEGIPKPQQSRITQRLFKVFGPFQREQTATSWRREQFRQSSLLVATENPYLFFPFISVVTPTMSAQMNNVNVRALIDDETLNSIRLRWNTPACHFLREVAKEGGFEAHPTFMALMDTLFPPDDNMQILHITTQELSDFLRTLQGGKEDLTVIFPAQNPAWIEVRVAEDQTMKMSIASKMILSLIQFIKSR
ncbi:hypothetical protein EAF04_008943 [Stromatinia cepivora]|nr:hypothetical protein EAF04_008943 [Stromatinia cepivora]